MSNLKNLKKERSVLRGSFTKASNKLEEILVSDPVNYQNLKICLELLVDKFDRLSKVDDAVLDLLWSDDAAADKEGEGTDKGKKESETYEIEYEAAEVYRDKFISLKVKAEGLIELEKESRSSNSIHNESHSHNIKQKFYRLPKLELRKFNGDLKDWVSFWGQFKSIDQNNNLSHEEKFQYLIQCITPGSKAANLVNSYPPSAENYPKVIEQLKSRFGREDLLVQVYVRELIAMVMKNAVKGKVCDDLCTLYDTLESQLRALESLGRTKDKFSEFLCPLVESCLPEELLRLWERKLNLSDEDNIIQTDKCSLEQLMEFLKKEVHSEEKINLAKRNFGCKRVINQENSVKKNELKKESELPTAVSLVCESGKKQNKVKEKDTCLFCEGKHESNTCFAAREKSLEERKKIVLEKRACFLCLKIGHSAQRCRAYVHCIVCRRRHAVILCTDLDVMKNKKKDLEKEENRQCGSTSSNISLHNSEKVILSTLVVKLIHNNKSVLVRGLIDTGSHKSYISEFIVGKLGLENVGQEIMIHGLFGGVITEPIKHKKIRVNISNLEDTFISTVDLLSQGTICSNIETLTTEDCKRINESAEIKLSEPAGAPREIHLLFGADLAGMLFTGDVKTIGGGLFAMKTNFGWTVMGKINRDTNMKENSAQKAISLFCLDESISQLWKIDAIGINDPSSVEYEHCLQQEKLQNYIETIKIRENGRYIVGLPWKFEHPPLPDNKQVAWKRVQTVKQRLERENRLCDYQSIFDDWVRKDIIELVTSAEKVCYYLPHRPVIKENSTTPIRPVFDASSHNKNSPSLNDCLEKGSNLIEDIPNILERFRDKQIGVTADIEKAFLQLEVSPEHRDFLRFFGVDGLEYRHKRVVFGVTSSPFLLNAVIKYHLGRMRNNFNDTVNLLDKSFYVDNCVASVSSVQELVYFINQSVEIMNEACFNLRGWVSNVLITPTTEEIVREILILGLVWNLREDTLRCKIPVVEECIVNKRTILSVAQRIFDPVGFTCPTTLCPKILLQKLWKLKVGWDDPVPEEFRLEFEKWKNSLYLLENVRIPRYTGRQENSHIHVFADASQDAYAACVFLRTDCTDEVKITLLRAKSRVAPIDKITIPRLELMACLIAVRLTNAVLKALDINEISVTYWSDSINALSWITKEGNWTRFVKNRVKEIRSLSLPNQWKYVPGELNPADLPSRGCSAANLLQRRWWEGPSWLKNCEDAWPVQDLMQSQSKMEEIDVQLISLDDSEDVLSRFQYFSSYSKVLRMVAWINRFCHNTKVRNSKRAGSLSSEEVMEAEKVIFKIIQKTCVVGHRRASLVRVIEDNEGLLRVETRLTEREDTDDFIHPIILVGHHWLVDRLIEEEHKKACHAGTQILLGVLREKFWIIGARKAIKKVISRCQRCKRYRTKHIEAEPVTLPKDRVKDSAAFDVTGIDLAGPLYTKEGKVWIVLFTCGLYRAIHLELVTSLSTSAFLQALRRFVSRRGRPSVIYTDNGTNFCGAENSFKNLDWNKISEDHNTIRIRWKFSPPTAAWWGGWWERLVRVVKELLRRTLGKARLTYEQLSTVLCECEAVINSRPLTYCTGDSEELIPLTPALFLRDQNKGGVEDIDQVEASHFSEKVRYRQKVIADLRQRFRREYLGLLASRDKNKQKYQDCQIGEVVLIGDDNNKRIKWPLGIIVKLHPGKDGKTRCVTVKTASGVIMRPIQRIYPLELKTNLRNFAECSDSPSQHEDATEDGPQDEPVLARTRRGRLVKQPERLDLFNNVAYCLFEDTSNKVGGCCGYSET